MSTTSISAKKRIPEDSTGRALRRSGQVPGVFYNSKRDVRYVQFDNIALTRLLKTGFGLVELDLEGEKLACVIREVQRHPVRGNIVHVDLFGVDKDVMVRSHVPLSFVGLAKGVKTDGGGLDVLVHDLEIECLPEHLPSHLDVDVSELGINDGIRLSDLEFEHLTLLGDPQMTLVHVVPPRIHDVAGPEVVEAATAEPEVITAKKEEAEE